MEIWICGGAFLVAKRSKTADVIQDVFAAGGRSPAGKCRISKGGSEGSFSGETGSFNKQKVPWTSERELAVRFDPASWGSLVIEFCQLGGFYRLTEKFL